MPKVSWKWGGKTYSGSVIKRTDDTTFARTHNGKVKVIRHYRKIKNGVSVVRKHSRRVPIGTISRKTGLKKVAEGKWASVPSNQPTASIVNELEGKNTDHLLREVLGEVVSYEDATTLNPKFNTTDIPESDNSELSREVRSNLIRQRETSPPEFNRYKVGQYAKDRFGDLYQLQNLPISKLVLKEGEVSQKQEVVDKYASWLKKSKYILPIKGVENYVTHSGKVVVQDGHHRVRAIKQLGLSHVPVWVSLTNKKRATRGLTANDVISDAYEKAVKTGTNQRLINLVKNTLSKG